jgi:hypothetical protein
MKTILKCGSAAVVLAGVLISATAPVKAEDTDCDMLRGSPFVCVHNKMSKGEIVGFKCPGWVREHRIAVPNGHIMAGHAGIVRFDAKQCNTNIIVLTNEGREIPKDNVNISDSTDLEIKD